MARQRRVQTDEHPQEGPAQARYLVREGGREGERKEGESERGGEGWREGRGRGESERED